MGCVTNIYVSEAVRYWFKVFDDAEMRLDILELDPPGPSMFVFFLENAKNVELISDKRPALFLPQKHFVRRSSSF